MDRKREPSPAKAATSHDQRAKKKRKIAATLLKVEALILIALAAVEVVATFTHDQIQEPLAIIGVIAFALMGAGGLLLSARGFTTGKMYGRAPAVLANLIALGVAYYQLSAGLWLAALPLALLALATLFFALSVLPA
jgi:hypothetical protein